MKNETHITPNTNGGWDAKDTGNKKVSRHFDTKKETVDWARSHSTRIGSELVVHNQNGRIAQKDSHGNDPCPPRDTK